MHTVRSEEQLKTLATEGARPQIRQPHVKQLVGVTYYVSHRKRECDVLKSTRNLKNGPLNS